MADFNRRYQDNAPGRFFVDLDCIYCGLCVDIAPNNFSPADSLDHDVVIKQPENDKEFLLCLEALESCPVESIGENKETA